MNATDAARAVLAAAPEALFVAALGTATSALRAASDDGPHLYMGGAMGCALPVAMGVAETRREREVVALLGDGELLMRPDALWCLASLRPANLLVVVLANGRYGITGGQAFPPPRFREVAGALELPYASVDVAAAVRELARPGIFEVEVDDHEWPGPSAFVDPPVVRGRFEAAALFRSR